MREKILQKIENNEDLTIDERRFYLVEILGLSPDEADQTIYRNDNQEDGVIID